MPSKQPMHRWHPLARCEYQQTSQAEHLRAFAIGQHSSGSLCTSWDPSMLCPFAESRFSVMLSDSVRFSLSMHTGFSHAGCLDLPGHDRSQ